MERIEIAEHAGHKIRSFIAIELPPQLRSAIRQLSAPLQRLALGVKWVPESNYHLTLKFLGGITPGDVSMLDVHLRAVAESPSLSLTVGGWGMFPSLGRPGVLWLGVGGDVEALRQLWMRLDDRMFEAGYQRDPRWHPHITLGRFRSRENVGALVKELQQSSAYTHAGSFQAEALSLMESRLAPSGPAYRTLSAYKLIPANI
jgi:2'-5' RNA ligase